jgi:hypothetical protein
VVVSCQACNGSAPLCARCRGQAYDAVSSTAWARGRRWGGELRQRWAGRRWPVELSEPMQVAAAARIADLTADAELLEQLGAGGSDRRA